MRDEEGSWSLLAKNAQGKTRSGEEGEEPTIPGDPRLLLKTSRYIPGRFLVSTVGPVYYDLPVLRNPGYELRLRTVKRLERKAEDT